MPSLLCTPKTQIFFRPPLRCLGLKKNIAKDAMERGGKSPMKVNITITKANIIITLSSFCKAAPELSPSKELEGQCCEGGCCHEGGGTAKCFETYFAIF